MLQRGKAEFWRESWHFAVRPGRSRHRVGAFVPQHAVEFSGILCGDAEPWGAPLAERRSFRSWKNSVV
jgi:hypothetical protein